MHNNTETRLLRAYQQSKLTESITNNFALIFKIQTPTCFLYCAKSTVNVILIMY